MLKAGYFIPSFSIDKEKVMCYLKQSNILPIGGRNEFKGSNQK